MITLISATHRHGSNTLKVAESYLKVAENKGVPMQLLTLEELPHDLLFSDHFGKRSEKFQQILNKYILPVEKMVLVVPEYNGSFPGILKAFIDAMSQDQLAGKKVALVGVATGRGGNTRGMDHLVGIFHYLKAAVYYDKVPVSQVKLQLDEQGRFADKYSLIMFENQLEGFVKY
jgi:NAD(P)H-dependent FMN reductase